MDDRFVLAAITRHRDSEGLFLALVWDKKMLAGSSGKGRMKASAKASAFENAKAKAFAAEQQVASFFRPHPTPAGGIEL